MEIANKDLYYIICVTEYFNGCGVKYQILTNKHYEKVINEEGNIRYKKYEGDVYLTPQYKSPYYCDYEGSYYKFESYKEAMDMAIELVRKGILPNVGISKEIANYSNDKVIISIIQRPLEDIIGYRYANYIKKNIDNINIKTPKYKKGDIVYLTKIEDGNIIYKTKIIDCELNENGKWDYFTPYWSEYEYTENDFVNEIDFMNHYEVKPNGNEYYYGQRCKIVEL